MKPIIEVKNLSKEYILTHNVQPYYTLRDFLTNLLKKPFEYFSSKNSSTKKEKFMALKDVNFSVMPGEVIGIIGKNGAGKSTLLKILSQITPPTSGSIHLRGRVASLLEVGTGFHPELTGRENIFLNGAILGMTQKEIKSKFDEIVEFAGIEKFLDTPVKRYSSGMYVRLAFAVAAHLEPEILIVDEVLAVGDAEFQKKCLGKMGDIAKQDGRTVLFVSHNMAAIKTLCSKAILLKNGKMHSIGSTDKIISEYCKDFNKASEVLSKKEIYRNDKLGVVLKRVDLLDEGGNIIQAIQTGKFAILRMLIETKYDRKNIVATVGVNSFLDDGRICVLYSPLVRVEGELSLFSPETYVDCAILKVPLMPGKYRLMLKIASNEDTLFYLPSAIEIEVLPGDFFGSGKLPESSWGGSMLVEHSWKSRQAK